MQKVAKLAGVSLSTVSRVINDHPRVSPATAEAVRQAIAQVQFTPQQRRMESKLRPGIQTANIAFLVLGTSGQQTAPAFEQLLRGVSEASAENNLNMIFSFVSDLSHLPPKITQRRVDGVLLHGERPEPAMQERLEVMPAVWLMANRERPTWGDQVMPDNATVGELAAKYLYDRGHRHMAFISANAGPWAFEVRAMSFARTARSLGATAISMEGPAERPGDLWRNDGVGVSTRQIIERLLQVDPLPTGLFVAEDRIVQAVHTSLAQHGKQIGPGKDFEIVSCNNERAHFAGLPVVPATIDTRAEAIGRRGVEQLLLRMRRPQATERIRVMVEPELITAETVQRNHL